MRKLGRWVPAACAVAIAALVGLHSARAAHTGLQDNGAACMPDYRNPSASFSRSEYGFQNLEASPIGVFCPIIKASGDSWSAGSILNAVAVYYSGSPPTDCTLAGLSTSGSVTYSAPLIQTTYLVNGLPVVWYGSQDGFNPFSNLVLGIKCTLPSQSAINGSTADQFIPNISGGI